MNEAAVAWKPGDEVVVDGGAVATVMAAYDDERRSALVVYSNGVRMLVALDKLRIATAADVGQRNPPPVPEHYA